MSLSLHVHSSRSASCFSHVKRKVKSVTFVLSHKSDRHVCAAFFFYRHSVHCVLEEPRGYAWLLQISLGISHHLQSIASCTSQKDSKERQHGASYVISKREWAFDVKSLSWVLFEKCSPQIYVLKAIRFINSKPVYAVYNIQNQCLS